MLLDPNPKSQYGSRSRTAKSTRIYADPNPQHCYFGIQGIVQYYNVIDKTASNHSKRRLLSKVFSQTRILRIRYF
jgi:hypothetical protein